MDNLGGKVQRIYGFNWNSTNPVPPNISGTTMMFLVPMFVSCALGCFFSVVLLHLISVITVRNGRCGGSARAGMRRAGAVAVAQKACRRR